MNKIYKLALQINYNFLRKVIKFKNFSYMSIRNRTGLTILMSTAFKQIILIDEDGNNNIVKEASNTDNTSIEDFTIQIRSACKISEDKIKELVVLLSKSIQKYCEDYRACLLQQIEILNKGMTTNPLSEYWDEMVKCRVEANNLKQEIIKFEGLVEYIGQVIFNLNICQNLLDKIEEKIPEIQYEYELLRNICKEQNELNRILEKELLKVDRMHIITSPKT